MKLFTKFFYKKVIFQKLSRTSRLWLKKNIAIIDTRTAIEFKEKHIKESIHIPRAIVKDELLKMNKKSNILLIGSGLRNNVEIINWARKNGFKNIFLAKQLISKWPYPSMLSDFVMPKN